MFHAGRYQGLTFTGDKATLTIETLQEVLKALDALRPVVYVWKGPYSYPRKAAPVCKPNEYVSPNSLYVVAGLGIIVGTEAWKIIDWKVFDLRWSDTYIPFEDQNFRA